MMQLDGVFFAKDSVNGHDADMFRFFKATPLIKEKRIAILVVFGKRVGVYPQHLPGIVWGKQELLRQFVHLSPSITTTHSFLLPITCPSLTRNCSSRYTSLASQSAKSSARIS